MIRYLPILVIGLLLAQTAGAAPTSLSAPQGMNVMTHSSFYVWKVEMAADEPLADLEVVFADLYNWDSRENTLYVQLLGRDDLAPFSFDDQGLFVGNDRSSYGNFLESFGGVTLGTYTDPDGPATAEDVRFAFDDDAMEVIRGSLVNGLYTFAIGVDSDCSFAISAGNIVGNSQPQVVPAPGAAALGGLGIGLVSLLRRKRSLM